MAGAAQRGAEASQDVRDDPMTVAALAEISGSTKCFNHVIDVKLKVFVRIKKNTLTGKRQRGENNRA
jgi:hypothetical protein